MSITLETIVGDAVVDENSLIYLQVEKARKPTITVNYARNVSRGYVVIETPEDIERFLMDNFARDEKVLASVYMMEEEERVKEHNERERQKIPDWEKTRETLIREWQERENHRIPDWEESESQRRAEYGLGLAIRQEDAERASLGYAGLVFDALERRGKRMYTIRTQYQRQWFLSDLRRNWLRKFLSQEGVQDNAIEDIVNLAMSKDAVLKEGLRGILVEKLGVEFPKAELKEPLPPYEPEPMPEPEPQPKPEPRPEITIKEVPSLLQELESVVLAGYKGLSLEGLNLTQQAWNDIGIVPQEIYNRIRENAKFLNGRYMLARVVGGNGDIGSLTLVELDTNQNRGLNQRIPRSLRNYFQRPSDIVEDAYMLSAILYSIITDYLSGDEKAVNIIKSEKRSFLQRAIYKKVIGRESSIISNLFPEHYGAGYSEEDARKYEEIAGRVDDALKNGLLGGEDSTFYRAAKMGVPVTELVGTIRHLIDSVPEELFRLRHLNDRINGARKELLDIQRSYDSGKILLPGGTQLRDYLQDQFSNDSREREELLPQLGSLVEGSTNYGSRFNESVKLVNAYGLGKETGYVTTGAGK